MCFYALVQYRCCSTQEIELQTPCDTGAFPDCGIVRVLACVQLAQHALCSTNLQAWDPEVTGFQDLLGTDWPLGMEVDGTVQEYEPIYLANAPAAPPEQAVASIMQDDQFWPNFFEQEPDNPQELQRRDPFWSTADPGVDISLGEADPDVVGEMDHISMLSTESFSLSSLQPSPPPVFSSPTPVPRLSPLNTLQSGFKTATGHLKGGIPVPLYLYSSEYADEWNLWWHETSGYLNCLAKESESKKQADIECSERCGGQCDPACEKKKDIRGMVFWGSTARHKKRTGKVWEHFSQCADMRGTPWVLCKYCHLAMTHPDVNTKNSTTGPMTHHLERNRKCPGHGVGRRR